MDRHVTTRPNPCHRLYADESYQHLKYPDIFCTRRPFLEPIAWFPPCHIIVDPGNKPGLRRHNIASLDFRNPLNARLKVQESLPVHPLDILLKEQIPSSWNPFFPGYRREYFVCLRLFVAPGKGKN